MELPWSINPFDESREVFFLYDFNHIFKNIRNAFLDNITILKDGTRFSKKDFIELFELVKKSEISPGAFLKEIMFTCVGSDRQHVGNAVNMMSEDTAGLLRMLFHYDAEFESNEANSKPVSESETDSESDDDSIPDLSDVESEPESDEKIEDFEPEPETNASKHAMADYFETMHRTFKLMNSKTCEDEDIYR